jgi:retron-type reverse transcriptase
MARTYSNLYPLIYDFANLHAAYLKARKGKRYSTDVLHFSARLETNLIDIQNKLIWKEYRPSPYHYFVVHEPKERTVAAAPFADRVVHHALCNVTEPIFEQGFIYDSYACRNSRGVLAGVNRTTRFMRRARRKWGRFYCLKGDVSKFFPSIDHAVLKSIIRKRIACPDTLELMDHIIDSDGSGTGLPIGNLTSQLWANV